MISSHGLAAPVFRIAGEGMQRALSRLDGHAGRIAQLGQADVPTADDPGGMPGSSATAASAGMDSTLARDVVGLIEARQSFLANLAVFKSSDRMAGALLDALA